MTHSGDLCQADVCLATTISRTSRLQKLLTTHISATAIPGTNRTIQDLNKERSGLLHVRTHVECLLNKLLEIKRRGASSLASKDHCIGHLDEYRIQLLRAGQQALDHIPSNAAAYSAVSQVIGFVDGSLQTPASPRPARMEPMAAFTGRKSSGQLSSYDVPSVASFKSPMLDQNEVLLYGSEEFGEVSKDLCMDRPHTSSLQSISPSSKVVRKWICRVLLLGGGLFCIQNVLRGVYKKSDTRQHAAVSQKAEYICQVLEVTRTPNVRVVRP